MSGPSNFIFNPDTHTYADVDGVLRPSVSQVIKAEGLISFAGISPQVLEHKRRLGTLVHQMTELWDNRQNLAEYDIPDEAWPYFDGWPNFCNDCHFAPTLIEFRMLACVHRMFYGMTLDRVGPINDEEHVIEIKTGSSEHWAWGVQLSGYDLGQNPTGKRRKRAVVQLGPQFPRGYKLFPYTDPADYTVWMNSLANTIAKINHGMNVFDAEPERIAA